MQCSMRCVAHVCLHDTSPYVSSHSGTMCIERTGAAVWDNTDPGSKKGRQLHLGSFPHSHPAATCAPPVTACALLDAIHRHAADCMT